MSRGESTYAIPGTYTWVCPAGVTSVSVVCVGGGGGGSSRGSYATGGGGGALAYINNYAVTPGTSYTVVVGVGGTAAYNVEFSTPTQVQATAGGTSSFRNTSTCAAGGGAGGLGLTGDTYNPVAGGVVIAGTGFPGGASGSCFSSAAQTGGGGGAGGYAGAGGSSANFNGSTVNIPAVAPTGGAGAYGARTSESKTAGGGGVGLLGQGSSGTVQTNNSGLGGGGGSGGQSGFAAIAPGWQPAAAGNGGLFGGGGGMAGPGGNANFLFRPGDGAGGAVRIVWPGATRLFPSTDVGTP